MTDNDALSQASAHLATARQLGRNLSARKMPALFNSRQLLMTIETVTDELSAAIDLINSTLATERERTQQLENAIDRRDLLPRPAIGQAEADTDIFQRPLLLLRVADRQVFPQ